MNDKEYRFVTAWLSVLESRMDTLEANSRSAASTVQPLVGPPCKDKGETAALARPVMLSKLEREIKETFKFYSSFEHKSWFELGVISACETFLQRIQDLDQGPIAENVPMPTIPGQSPPEKRSGKFQA